MSRVPPDLLQPSLDSRPAGPAPFSPNAVFYLGFLGATIAVAIFAGINARRMGRLERQWPIYAAGIVAGLAATVLLVAMPRGVETRSLAGLIYNVDLFARIGVKVIGLGYAILVYAINRPLYAASRLTGADFHNPWPAGIACWALDAAATMAIIYFVGGHA